MPHQPKKAKDPELERAIARALNLRITLEEICEAAKINRVLLWRWRKEAISPRHLERQALLDTIDRLCNEQLAKYMEN